MSAQPWGERNVHQFPHPIPTEPPPAKVNLDEPSGASAPQAPTTPVQAPTAAQAQMQMPTASQGQAALKGLWVAIDRTLNTVPWYFTLAGGVALGVWASKKMR